MPLRGLTTSKTLLYISSLGLTFASILLGNKGFVFQTYR